jgi:hypothetical protein
LCYKCRCRQRGKPVIEQHHLYGRANSPRTIPLPANLHRLVSDRQQDWPQVIDVRRRRDRLRWLLGLLRCITEYLVYLRAQLVQSKRTMEQLQLQVNALLQRVAASDHDMQANALSLPERAA